VVLIAFLDCLPVFIVVKNQLFIVKPFHSLRSGMGLPLSEQTPGDICYLEGSKVSVERALRGNMVHVYLGVLLGVDNLIQVPLDPKRQVNEPHMVALAS